MSNDSRYVRAYRGSKWTEKLSFECLGEGDVFCLFETDGTQVVDGDRKVFRALSAPRRINGILGLEAEPYTETVPEIS